MSHCVKKLDYLYNYRLYTERRSASETATKFVFIIIIIMEI